MSRATHRLSVAFVLISSLVFAMPAGAAEPVPAANGREVSDDRPGDVEPQGAAACDVKLSLVGGPLVDADFSVRTWEPFIVWGFGFPAESMVIYEFVEPSSGDSFSFDGMTDSAGEFAQEHAFLVDGPDSLIYPLHWTLTAEPAGGGCTDTIAFSIQSPYPFTDIDGFEGEIAWLYREGITGGCTATRFCPTAGVTRGQMAAFLARALSLPSTSTDFFDDDDGTIFEGDINRLAAAGITGGCDTRRYCVDALITRQQMASFLTRAFSLPPSSTDFFTDDNSSIHENDINALAASGITGGCATGRYCPTSNVTRAQMAAFLYRAFN